MIALVLLLALAAPDADAPAADAGGGAPATDAASAIPQGAASLDDARAALEARAPDCERRAAAVLQQGGLEAPQAAEAWSLRARCALVAGDRDRATRAFAAALRYHAALAPVDDDTFRQAADALLPASIAFTAIRAGDALELTLVGDDLQLARGAVVEGAGGDERARVPLEVGRARHRVSGVALDDARARLLDRWGNTLKIAAIEVAPAESELARTATAATSSGGPGALTYAGAAVLGAGMLGLTVAGVGTALAGADVLDEAPLWVAGLGAGAVLFGVGAGLVVVDQLP